MNSLNSLRKAVIRLGRSFDSKPMVAQSFSIQTKVVSNSSTLAHEVQPVVQNDIQRADGTFAFLPGYDRPGF